MKREIRKAINKGIKESEKHGYKWKIENENLKWEYLTVEYFRFEEVVEDDETNLKVVYVMPHLDLEETFAYVFVGNKMWSDVKTLEEAYELATKEVIEKCYDRF